MSQDNERSKFFRDLENVLDEQFPKGECEERGTALVLFSYANIYYDKEITDIKRRVSFLRQWLNEDRIDNPSKGITNESIESWLFNEKL